MLMPKQAMPPEPVADCEERAKGPRRANPRLVALLLAVRLAYSSPRAAAPCRPDPACAEGESSLHWQIGMLQSFRTNTVSCARVVGTSGQKTLVPHPAVMPRR